MTTTLVTSLILITGAFLIVSGLLLLPCTYWANFQWAEFFLNRVILALLLVDFLQECKPTEIKCTT